MCFYSAKTISNLSAVPTPKFFIIHYSFNYCFALQNNNLFYHISVHFANGQKNHRLKIQAVIKLII